jgi:hypothetical protein
VASVFKKALEAMIAFEQNRYNTGKAEYYKKWKKPTPYIIEKVRIEISSCPMKIWSNWTKDQRQTYIQILFSPMEPSMELIQKLIEERKE